MGVWHTTLTRRYVDVELFAFACVTTLTFIHMRMTPVHFHTYDANKNQNCWLFELQLNKQPNKAVREPRRSVKSMFL